jgi:hypothetical protein
LVGYGDASLKMGFAHAANYGEKMVFGHRHTREGITAFIAICNVGLREKIKYYGNFEHVFFESFSA